MIFSGFLTLLLLGLIVYAWLQKKDFPLVGRVLPLVCMGGLYVAWFPDKTSDVAEWVGIGRGVDLMLYVWMLASGMLILVLHLKLVSHERRLTDLARYVAIANAQVPSTNAQVPDTAKLPGH